MIVFHGGTEKIEKPVIIKTNISRDFGLGFYCTDIRTQAEKWAFRQARVRKKTAFLNIYEFDSQKALKEINFKIFSDYDFEWLDLVVNCRKNSDYKHGYEIVFGKIANDDVGETVQAVINSLMPKDYALEKLVFIPANNQYCFCTETALTYLVFKESIKME